MPLRSLRTALMLTTIIAGYAPEQIPYGISRYQNETRRLYRVLDTALAKSKSGFLVGDRLTIADVSCWGWVASASKFRPPPPFDFPIVSILPVLTVATSSKRVVGYRYQRVPPPQEVALSAAGASWV